MKKQFLRALYRALMKAEARVWNALRNCDTAATRGDTTPVE